MLLALGACRTFGGRHQFAENLGDFGALQGKSLVLRDCKHQLLPCSASIDAKSDRLLVEVSLCLNRVAHTKNYIFYAKRHMELKDFVKETLVQVIGGIVEAQNVIRSTGLSAEIAPQLRNNRETLEKQGKSISNSGHVAHQLDFDIAVTVSEKTQTQGGIAIAIAGVIGLGGHGKSEAGDVTASRIKFSVPIVFPYPAAQK